jgi:hypothetical protein
MEIRVGAFDTDPLNKNNKKQRRWFFPRLSTSVLCAYQRELTDKLGRIAWRPSLWRFPTFGAPFGILFN